MNNIFDFFVDFSINVSRLFNWLFFERFEFTIGDNTYSILPVGLLVGAVALSIGIIRRIL